MNPSIDTLSMSIIETVHLKFAGWVSFALNARYHQNDYRTLIPTFENGLQDAGGSIELSIHRILHPSCRLSRLWPGMSSLPAPDVSYLIREPWLL